MIKVKIDLVQVKVIPAEKQSDEHKKNVWKIFNENLEFTLTTHEPVPYDHHCEWWETVFEKEYIYVILYETVVCGFIRLTKFSYGSKEPYEISIALGKEFQNSGIGSIGYRLFENEMKKIAIPQIIAKTIGKNIIGQTFFEKNDFKKFIVKYIKKL